MGYKIISFTENGIRLSKRIAGLLAEEEVSLFTKCSYAKPDDVKEIDGKELGRKDAGEREYDGSAAVRRISQSVGDWTKEQMSGRNTLIFIGACGIAVRALAPCITDKLHDNPALVIDEAGKFVIPLLSGHMGRANETARELAAKLGATPVVTTATDINRKFAVDLFAKHNGLYIENKDGIAKVSAKVLAGEEITVSVEPGHLDAAGKIPDGIRVVPGFADIAIASEQKDDDALIRLTPKEYIVGIGCQKGKEAEKIETLIRDTIREAGISPHQIYALASIDVKKEEEGILAFAEKENIPFLTFSAAGLQEVEGSFHASSFVKEKVGVDNVCERAALKACGAGGRLVCEKRAQDGMTIAVAKRDWKVKFDGNGAAYE